MRDCYYCYYNLTASKGLKTPIDNIPHGINNPKHSPPHNLPHLLCSAYNLVTLFFLILLAILLQLFLFLFEFIPFRFLPFRACQRKSYRLINPWKTQNYSKTRQLGGDVWYLHLGLLGVFSSLRTFHLLVFCWMSVVLRLQRV